MLSFLGLGLAAAALPPGGLTVVAAGTAGAMAPNLATDLYKVLDRRVAERFFDHRRGIAENNAVIRALWLSHVNALRGVLKQVTRSETLTENSQWFPEALDHLLKDEVAAIHGDPLADTSRYDTTPHALIEAFNGGLTAQRATEDSTEQDKATQLRHAVEAAVLTDLRAGLLGP
ncbi:MAG: hypothetical protein K9H25_13510 [Rhodospirillum sp.]|nr:hypothetical protein [Rhodospirillum sp.]MCF8490630.1 hypothetical protein [Rhodospirillum sp.]